MAASSVNADSLLAEAAELERQCEWEEAAGVFRRILQAMPADRAERPVISLRLALCHETAAFQTDSASALQGKMEEAIAVYRKTEQMVGRDSLWGRRAAAGRLRLEGMLAEDDEAQGRLLDNAIDLQRSVVMELERRGLSSAWLEAGNFALLLLYERYTLNSELAHLLKEGLALAEKLVKSDTRNGDVDGIALAHVHRVNLALYAMDHFEDWNNDPSRVDRLVQDALALENKVQDRRVLAALLEATLYPRFCIGTIGFEVTQEDVDKGVAAARVTLDRHLIGRALWDAMFVTHWRLEDERDEEQAQKLFQEATRLFKEAEENLRHLRDPVSQYFLGNAYGDLTMSHLAYARSVTDRVQRKRLIEEAVTALREAHDRSIDPMCFITCATIMRHLNWRGSRMMSVGSWKS